MLSVARRLAIPLVLLVIPLASWLSPGAYPEIDRGVAGATKRIGDAWVEERDGLRILHLSGTPYEMGYQHGVLLREEVRARIRDESWGGLIGEGRVSHLLLLRHAREVGSLVPSEYREEMAGLADGAMVSYSEVLLLNTCGDLIAQPWPDSQVQDLLLSLSPPFMPHLGPGYHPERISPAAQGGSSGVVPGRSPRGTFALFGSATRDRTLLHGLDFASPPPPLEEVLLVVYRPESGNGFVGLGLPGTVGFQIGLNEEHISVTALPSPSQDASLDGTPLPLVLREVLQYSGDIPTAVRILASADRTTGHNVLLGDGKRPLAEAVEFSRHLYAVFEAENDFLVRSNHYLDATLAETQRSLSDADEDSSWEHLEVLLKAVDSGYGRFNASRLERLIRDMDSGGEEGQTAQGERVVLGVVLAVGDLEMRLVTASAGDPSPVLVLDEEL